MAKNKKHNSSSDMDSKIEKTKKFIRKSGEIAAEVGNTLAAIGAVYNTYKGLKNKN